MHARRLVLCSALLLSCAHAPSPAAATDDAATVRALADDYVAAYKKLFPESAELSGLTLPHHDGLSDNSLAMVTVWDEQVDRFLARVDAINAEHLFGKPEWVLLGFLRDTLESERAVRPCHFELWPAHQFGWQTTYIQLLDAQPVGTAVEREEALKRWAHFANYLDVEIADLKEGVRRGYSAPKRNVELAIAAIAELAAMPKETSPLAGPARRANDAAFTAAWQELLGTSLRPAIVRYQLYLAEYLKAARTSIGVSALPEGALCYRGALRASTTTDVDPDQLFERGQARVTEREQRYLSLAREVYGQQVTDLASVRARLEADPKNRVASGDEILAIATAALARAQAAAPRWFSRLPREKLVIKPYDSFEARGFPSARYESGARDGSRPGYYRIDTINVATTRRTNLEITTFHEGFPGHHLQIALAQELPGAHDYLDLAGTGAFAEGWARYTETLSDEMGLYSTPIDRMGALAGLPTGMVVDPGIHAKGWTREQAIAYTLAKQTDDTPESAASYVDRIAVWPGQMVTYGYGEITMLELRALAEKKLGPRFDVRGLHDHLLEHGALPLPMLRAVITRWISETKAQPAP